ncbi:cobalamin (vitamin B12) biosynthesis CbiX protein [Halodesulfurarchaeum formicicum]|uniref:Cobalamin (Vitamin B12) biosynthesis CbiX protein n=1 Tax=Halodesulfurarchaeum formicicum TaxID=1873524 RepID=A0A1D8S6N8_9EURY|nr:sirohydrochlorin chelatase [Halodesulfurarchaeum formicicum]AOW81011.1 cobalamin (vitamin B12) biosynthesis CbiX protein [Halodesulfurarchaeum formicicum]
MTTNTPVLLAGHGSRREESNEQVKEVAAALEDRLGERVMPAYIELTEPLIDEGIRTLAPEAESVTVVPLSLFAAGHVKNDIPLFVQHARQAYPDVEFNYGSNLGARPEMIEIVADRISEAAATMDADPETDDVAVVFVARGSSDPDANAEAYRLARLVQEGRPYTRVEPTFIGITEPLFDQTLTEVSRHEPDAVIVMPYMLGDGVLNQRIADTVAEYDTAHPEIETAHTDVLGVDERLIRALEHRVMEARQGTVSMSCDQCIYKVTLEDYEDEVGGEKAFVHSLEHTLAHVSDDHEHSHDHGHGDGHDHSHGDGDDHSHSHGDGEDDHGDGHGHSHGDGHGHGHGHNEDGGHGHGHDHGDGHGHGDDHGHKHGHGDCDGHGNCGGHE